MRDVGCGTVVATLAVVAVVAAVGIPHLFRNTCEGGNETAGLATLRNLGSCQAQFKAGKHCDVDGDGNGEYGTFAELTAADGIRADASGGSRWPTLRVAILSPALARVNDDGLVTKSGYAFRIFLPGAKGGGVHEKEAGHWSGYRSADPVKCPPPPTPKAEAPPADPVVTPAPPTVKEGTPLTNPVDVEASESHWCAYSWPVAYGNSGNRVFFTDEDGDVWQCENKGGRYQGMLSGPGWDAAMPRDGGAGWVSSKVAEYVGRDGNTWKRTN